MFTVLEVEFHEMKYLKNFLKKLICFLHSHVDLLNFTGRIVVFIVFVFADILDRTSTLGAMIYDPRSELRTPSSKPGSTVSTPKPA